MSFTRFFFFFFFFFILLLFIHVSSSAVFSSIAGIASALTDSDSINQKTAGSSMFLISPGQQASAFQATGKIAKTGGGGSSDTMPKVQQKLIHKENMPVRQENKKSQGQNGKLAAASASATAGIADTNQNTLEQPFMDQMAFGTENWTTISTQIGANALLPCTVHAIGDGVVSSQFYV